MNIRFTLRKTSFFCLLFITSYLTSVAQVSENFQIPTQIDNDNRIDYRTCIDSYEPNNDVGKATDLSISTHFDTINHCLTSNDEDWFKINLNGINYYALVRGGSPYTDGGYGIFSFTWIDSDGIYFETMPNGGEIDTHIDLYDTDGTTLLASDDNGSTDSLAKLYYTFPGSGIDLGFTPYHDIPTSDDGVLSFNVELRNQGLMNAGTFTIKYYLSLDGNINPFIDYEIGSEVVSSMPANSTLGLSFSADIANMTTPSIPAATYYIGFAIDVNGQIIETTENNNIGVWSSGPFFVLDFASSSTDINNEATVKVFPNPANEYLQIEHDLEGTWSLEMLNIVGQTVWTQENIQQNERLMSKDLPVGTYVLRLYNNENGMSIYKKVQIVH